MGKQAKQKRNNRKGKEKKRGERTCVTILYKHEEENPSDEKKESIVEYAQLVPEKSDMLEDVSDISDSLDGIVEVLRPDSEDRDASPINWDTDASEVIPPTEASSSGVCSLSSVPNGTTVKGTPSVMDDSSSTCSTDSVPSLVINGSYKGNSFTNYQNLKSPSRGKHQQGKAAYDGSIWVADAEDQPSRPATDAGEHNDVSESNKVVESEVAAVSSLHDQAKSLEQNVLKEVVPSLLSIKDPVETERSKEKTASVTSSPRSPPRNLQSIVQLKSVYKSTAVADPDPVPHIKVSFNGQQQTDQVAALSTSSQVTGVFKSETLKSTTTKQTEKPMEQQVPLMSRPSSAPLVPDPRPTVPVVSMVHKAPLLARSVSAAGRLGPDLSPATHCYVPQSYRNAKMGNPVGSSSSSLPLPISPSPGVNPSPAYSQQPSLASAPMFLPQSSDRIDPNSVQSGFPFGTVTRDVLPNGHQWMQSPQRDTSRIMHCNPSSLANDIRNLDLYKPVASGSREHFSNEFPACTYGRQAQGVLADEFPHLDIINDLLDDEHGAGISAKASTVLQSFGSGPHLLNRQFSFPFDASLSSNDIGSSTGSCRFERTRSYQDDGFQRGYSSSSDHFDSVREYIPQATTSLPYSNGQMDGMVPNLWQKAGSDLPLLGMRNTDSEGYPYCHPDYSNLSCGANGYAVFRPSNGH